MTATRTGDQWEASEVDLDDIADIEDAAEVMRDVNPDAEVALLFVDADDSYLTILRLDQGDDLRAFGSDAEYASQSRLGETLLADLEPDDHDDFDEEDEEAAVRRPTELDAEPVGEADLLSDLGVPSAMLLALCAKDGMLPTDVMTELAERIGCAEALEAVSDA
ncbi:tRNA adenosine deaminase-associated protein [Natronoglycomyces albus]|uniref:tRNA adenosine deaminase-associated protein n=1 Tax=Natronoglycomyces albus TaxID=2811108 RepID=UPI001FE7B6B9|nr:tRNA adenosine deaminase-associated protein [Natronoglycomyces albus]